MPRGDGTGPQNKNQGGGRGQMGGPLKAGPAGQCVCPKCGQVTPHRRQVPCNNQKCPACGSTMTRT